MTSKTETETGQRFRWPAQTQDSNDEKKKSWTMKFATVAAALFLILAGFQSPAEAAGNSSEPGDFLVIAYHVDLRVQIMSIND